MVKVSVVIPARNERENMPDLLDAIGTALGPLVAHEVIVVDDGSTDGMTEMLQARMVTDPTLRVLRNDRSAGQSAAVHSGVIAARGAVVCTLDGDGQNPPRGASASAGPLARRRCAGRSGRGPARETQRHDVQAPGLALCHGLRSWMLNDHTRDTGCGLKAFRREAFLALPYFNHMHRYLPALFERDGWRVVHVDVAHRARGGGRSNYSNLQRGLVGIVDLFGVAWLIRRKKTASPHPLGPLERKAD